MVALFAQQSNIVEFPQKSNEWYTPARYVEAAREVMGGIDLDPASCELANRTVKATRFYTAKENGLEQPWYGRIWLNPPYGMTHTKSNIALFVERLLREYKAENVKQAVVLTVLKPDRLWFEALWDFPICLADNKIFFHRPGQSKVHGHMFGTAFAYLGPHEQKFINIFQQFGTVARRVSVPKVQPVNLSLWEVS